MAASGLMVSLLLAAAAGASTALDEVCGVLGENYVTPEACASALCRDPSSPCRAPRDAARLAAVNATAARDSVAAASRGPAGVPAAVRRRRGGAGVGGGVRGRGAVPGRSGGAAGGAVVPAGCDGVAAGTAVPAENGGFGAMATVAHAVLASLSKGY
ncbi:uncharacterized protein C2845_PM05G02670 [Panicum miliaceum]|uniref:Antifreeze protein Maxi-like n=1 Tax=Panicum miliaceum TaxID=4540 RepID=A0A3L6SV00_PANMI|nr:uncharacterized protein C2845_PM05G02670 [Panicum miliaceum]